MNKIRGGQAFDQHFTLDYKTTAKTSILLLPHASLPLLLSASPKLIHGHPEYHTGHSSRE